MSFLRIVLAQINSTVGDLSGNAEKIKLYIGKAKEKEADLVAFPEFSLCGYPPEDLILKKQFVCDCQRALEDIIGETEGITCLVGLPEGAGPSIYNAAALIHNRKLIGTYHKMILPNYGVFDEKRYFEPGEKGLVFIIKGMPVGINICEDSWFPDCSGKLQVQEGNAQAIINISASPYYAGKRSKREQTLARFSQKNGCFLFYCNLVGGQDELIFDGGSLVLDPQGEILANAKQFQEDMLLFDLEVGKSELPGSEDSSILSKYIISSGSKEGRKKLVTTSSPWLDDVEEIYSALVLGLRDYVRKNGFPKVVIGISGGIDSALTATIAFDALGAEAVVGVSMPSRFSSKETREDAQILSNNLGLRFLCIPIEHAFKGYLEILKSAFSGTEQGVAEENIQARIRGNLLMALSNKFGWLVLTTGNKSEAAVGYCTLYGDMAGGFGVIKDVPKTLVYKLTEFRNQKAGKDLIPTSIVKREPSAELRPDQKDQDSLPPYEILDPILQAYVEEDRGYNEILAMGFDKDVVKKVVHMVDTNEYKRRQSPPGIKITSKAFGKDWRLPITNRYTHFYLHK